MWEITLSGKYEDIAYILDMENVLKDTFNKDILTIITIDDEVNCNIAVINDGKVDLVKKIIIESMLKIVKSEYFRENIKIFTLDKSLNSFMISSLVLLDLLEEIEYVTNRFEINKYLNFRSFVYFKLNVCIEKWKYICNYINNAFDKEIDDVIYLEFLKFITDLQKPKHDVLYLENNNKVLELFDSHHHKLKKLPISDEIGVIVNLIMMSPKKIVVNCMESLTDKVSHLINYIFDEKLCYLL